jgi:NAD(P)-dependent dehydrogenase (short-subunit alcohol dehydrogenase family)
MVRLARHRRQVNKRKERAMRGNRVALVTGANQGVGLQVARELVANGLTVLVGSRNFERGGAAAKEIGPGAAAAMESPSVTSSWSATFTRWENVTIPW